MHGSPTTGTHVIFRGFVPYMEHWLHVWKFPPLHFCCTFIQTRFSSTNR
ncbi:hypothetical protein TCAP_00745 [Tolypocladium capitatum]|uniref:Uncharacterized protein n=1 Tax=Tolypocladium capitatum TaxID=45235 RepID=A0A2K3QP75_9HYPO|nr:hypothetical protein TCAP_00745 [Tolypocladium capitatum]